MASTGNSDEKKIYEKPVVESESLFDQRVLICGKCRGAGNVTKQAGCSSFPRNS
ncbi:MAG: hypothetical protein AB1546_10705 [bacterium]